MGFAGPDARADGHCLRELPAYSGYLSLLSARRLKLLRPSAIVVNTARGEVIDETVLIRMLENREIAGAGLDVFEHEPAVPPKLMRLAKSGRVTLLPHMGSATVEAASTWAKR